MKKEPLTPKIAEELVGAAAIDFNIFTSTFLPATFGQKSPEHTTKIVQAIDNPNSRLVAIKVFRGGGKTTSLRALVARAVAYNHANLVLFTSASERHSGFSLDWLRELVEGRSKNGSLFATVFGLEKGSVWNSERLELRNRALNTKTDIIALGVTGQTRGYNISDSRPDMIILDDPCTIENSGGPETRQQLEDRVYGGIIPSLAPTTDNPLSRAILLQTPQFKGDLIDVASQSPAWHTISCPILTPSGESAWPARWSTRDLQKIRDNYSSMNQFSIWLREYMCEIVSDEGNYFDVGWLRYWDNDTVENAIPAYATRVYAIDPVPPPSEAQLAKGLRDKDYEVHCILAVWGDKIAVEHIEEKRNPDPDWTKQTYLHNLRRYSPLVTCVDTVNYQRALFHILKSASDEARLYTNLREYKNDKRPKSVRIRQAISKPASRGVLHVHRSQTALIDQFRYYPSVAHDDHLDCVMMGLQAVDDLHMLTGQSFPSYQKSEPPLVFAESCP